MYIIHCYDFFFFYILLYLYCLKRSMVHKYNGISLYIIYKQQQIYIYILVHKTRHVFIEYLN